MKNILRTIALSIIVAMAVGLIGCTGNDASSGSSQGGSQAGDSATGYNKTEYNLVFIPKLVHEWYEDVKIGVDKAVAELAEKGITVNYSWEPPADAVVTEQIAKIEAAASKNPDGIAVAIIDASASTTVINELVDQGINVTTFDNDAPDSKRKYYCGHSTNYEDGVEIAERLAKSLNEEGEVAILAGTLSAINHQERVKGFEDTIAKYPNMSIVDKQADEDSIEIALNVTEGYLATYPNLKAIYGVNAASPIGAARALKDANKAGDIKIVGMGENDEAMQYMDEGTIELSRKKDVPTYGYNIVYAMLEIADGRTPAKVADEIPAIFVTKDNVSEFLN